MKFQTITIFTKYKGLEQFSRKEFVENLDLGMYDGQTIEIVRTEY